jgi:diguanylate cyclase (GGDEF)-like protein
MKGMGGGSDPRRLQALIHAQSRIASSGLDLRALLQAGVVDALELTGAESSRIELLDEAGTVTRGASQGGIVEVGVAPPAGSVTARAAGDRKLVSHADDLTGSAIAAPLLAGDRLLGVLTVEADAPTAFGDEDADTIGILARSLSHHIENARRYEAAVHTSRIDALTSLGNRRAMEETLDAELARHARYGNRLTLILVDLDGFKAVNDTHGHQTGDRVLVQVAQQLSAVRGADSAFRLGGDEFAIILPETGVEEARLVARRLARRIREETFPEGLTASWGVGEAAGPEAERLIADADAELYERKRGENSSEKATG